MPSNCNLPSVPTASSSSASSCDSPEPDDECIAMFDMAATKRRSALHAPPTTVPKSPTATFPLPPTFTFVAGRRRRLFAYLAAFATMLALSSMLDLRRAALNARPSDRITLSLPAPPAAASVPTAADDSATPADGAALAQAAANAAHSKLHSTTPTDSLSTPQLPHHHHHQQQQQLDTPSSSQTADSTPHDSTSSSDPAALPDRKLSEQELKDDVDQLISHVEQESSANGTASGDSSSTATNAGGDSAATQSMLTKSTPTTAITATNVTTGPTTNVTTAVDDPNANVEEQFAAAQTAMEAVASNSTLKALLDTQEARTLRALALQGARGNCEKAADPSNGGLFKTDAEAAGGDIEKTDALWGAWCVFSGRYRSDAMRDYVARTRALLSRLHDMAERGEHPSAVVFDEQEPKLDDVLVPDAQAALRQKAEQVLPHLSENDARLLAALALQATFGDCNLYTRRFDGARTLSESIFNRTASRGDGALWGAWCVFARRKRPHAAVTLAERVDGFWQQLSAQQNQLEKARALHNSSSTATAGAAAAATTTTDSHDSQRRRR